MLGAIIGDIVGSIYEFNNYKSKDFPFFSPQGFFTDDSVMTAAICKALLDCKGKYHKLSKLAVNYMQEYGKLYPNMSYGGSFIDWLNKSKPQPYFSCGNGSAMRVSAVPYFASSLEEVRLLAKLVTEVTHNHPEGIKAAQATAEAIYLALNKKSKEYIKEYIETNYYNLDFTYEGLVNNYRFTELAQETVPQAIYCFLISESFEDAIRIGVSIGGDSDTLCAIIGAIAEAYYGIDEKIAERALTYLDERLLSVYNEFKQVTGK